MGTAIKRLESFRDISLEKFYANVVQNGISKDNEDYVKRIEYFLENKTLEYEKLAEASEIAKNIMAEYEPGDEHLFDVFSRADKRMYDRKKQRKKA